MRRGFFVSLKIKVQKVQGSKFKVDLRSSSVTTRPFVSKLPMALAAPDVQKFKVKEK